MPIEQAGVDVTVKAFFVESKVGKTGLTVTVDVYNPAGTKVVTGASATEVGDGLYTYTILGSSIPSTAGEWVAIFKTATTSVDVQHIPTIWVIGRVAEDVADVETKVDMAQADLDTITGSDGVTLATTQGNYAPAKAGDNMGTVSAVTGGINTGAGVITTLDALDTAQDSQHATTQSTLSTIAGYLDTEIAAILADTNELQGDWADGGRLDLLLDAIKVVTDLLPDGGALTALLADISSILTDTGTTLEARFTGMTNLAQWLGAMAGKQAPNATALSEINATGAGSGTYSGTTDSLEANRDNIGTAGAGLTEAGGTGDHLTGITVETEVDEAAIAAAVIAGLGGATIVVQSPVRSNGDISIKAGNDYPAGKIVWNVTGASDMTGATVTFYRGDFSAPVTVSNQGEATQTFTLPLTRAVTAALATGPMAFDVNALLADDTLETVIEGRAFVKPSAIVA